MGRFRVNEMLLISCSFESIRSYFCGKGSPRTFNMGTGLTVVAAPALKNEVIAHFGENGCKCYEIGRIVDGQNKVIFDGSLNWQENEKAQQGAALEFHFAP